MGDQVKCLPFPSGDGFKSKALEIRPSLAADQNLRADCGRVQFQKKQNSSKGVISTIALQRGNLANRIIFNELTHQEEKK